MLLDVYYLISLLNTLGKLLEEVITRRLLYYIKKYKLLLDTPLNKSTANGPPFLAVCDAETGGKFAKSAANHP